MSEEPSRRVQEGHDPRTAAPRSARDHGAGHGTGVRGARGSAPVKSHQLASDLPRQVHDRLAAVRALVAVAARPDRALSISALAEATGLAEWVARHILTSPEYSELVWASSHSYVSTLLMRAVEKLGRIIETGAPHDSLQAIATLARLHQTFAGAAPRRSARSARQAAEALLEELTSSADRQ